MEPMSIIWLSVTCVCLLAGFFSLPFSPLTDFGHHTDQVILKEGIAVPFSAPKHNVWADLKDDEVTSVLDFLHIHTPQLNLTSAKNASSWQNSIQLLEALAPPKSGALPFLDEAGEAPARYARVVVNQGASDIPTICEYRVGPLPITAKSNIEPLKYANGQSCVDKPLPDFSEMTSWFASAAKQYQELFVALLGSSLDSSKSTGIMDQLILGGRMTRTQKTEDPRKIQLWTEVHTKSDAWSLLPQGFYLQLDVTSRNSSNWQLLKCFYNGKIYNSIDDLHRASKAAGFAKSNPNINDGWADTVDFETANVHDNEAPAPVMIQPGGPRYKIDEAEQYVEWMGFEFYFTTRAANAMALYDIKFNGERIMYELGLQEALAAYSGANPMQSGQNWLDTYFGMGQLMFPLVRGYDCPAYATYVATNYSIKEEKWSNPDSICIFEYTADYPLQRHTTSRYVSISRNTYLVVKSVSTVGNYDYTFEYMFYLDGTVEVKVRASGYIFTAFYDAASLTSDTSVTITEDEYGYKVRDVVSGSMHDHVINFKADLDIGSTANSLVRVDIEPTTKSYPWDGELESPRNTMHLATVPITQEGGFDWPRNSGSMYIVHDNHSVNAWGEKRGYRIVPGTGMGTPPHLTILNSTGLEQATNWAGHDLWVLKQKDTEPRSAHERNVLNPGDPLVDFAKFVDDEDIVQEDL